MYDDTTAVTTPTTRRQLLRAGTVGAAAAALLAACSTQDGPDAGVSGTPKSSTSVPPTVPPYTPKESDLANNEMLLRTAASIELFAADVYATYSAKLTDEAWKTTAERFGLDHEAAAEEFNGDLAFVDQINEPNPWLVENSLTPVEPDLTDDRAILAYFEGIESTITATYVTTAGQWVIEDDDDVWRQRYCGFAGAAARRVSVLGNGGEGAVPPDALFSTLDLIPNDAYMVTEPSASEEKAIEEEDAAVDE